MGFLGRFMLLILALHCAAQPNGKLPFRLPLCHVLGCGWVGAEPRAIGLYNPRRGSLSLTPSHFHRSHSLFYALSLLRSLSTAVFSSLFAVADMEPRKTVKAGATGEDPSSLGEGWSCYIGKSMTVESDLTEFVLAGIVSEEQVFCPGEHVCPSPGDGRTVMFAACFDAGLRLPCDDFLPAILKMYGARIPQLSPSAFVKLAMFTWMC